MTVGEGGKNGRGSSLQRLVHVQQGIFPSKAQRFSSREESLSGSSVPCEVSHLGDWSQLCTMLATVLRSTGDSKRWKYQMESGACSGRGHSWLLRRVNHQMSPLFFFHSLSRGFTFCFDETLTWCCSSCHREIFWHDFQGFHLHYLDCCQVRLQVNKNHRLKGLCRRPECKTGSH